MSTDQVIALVTQLGVPAVLLGILLWKLVPAMASFAERLVTAQREMTQEIKAGFQRVEDRVLSSQREVEARIAASSREVQDEIHGHERQGLNGRAPISSGAGR